MALIPYCCYLYLSIESTECSDGVGNKMVVVVPEKERSPRTEKCSGENRGGKVQ